MKKVKFECINELLKGALVKACKLNGIDNQLSKGLCKALGATLESQDDDTRTGAAIICEGWAEVVSGCNAFIGNNKEAFPTTRQGETPVNTEYPYVVHAEERAVKNFLQRVHELQDKEAKRTMVCTLFPCNECMKDVVDAGITELIYIVNDRPNACCSIEAKKIAEACGVKLTSAEEAFGKDTVHLVELAFAGLKDELSEAIANIEKRGEAEETQAYINLIEAPEVDED